MSSRRSTTTLTESIRRSRRNTKGPSSTSARNSSTSKIKIRTPKAVRKRKKETWIIWLVRRMIILIKTSNQKVSWTTWRKRLNSRGRTIIIWGRWSSRRGETWTHQTSWSASSKTNHSPSDSNGSASRASWAPKASTINKCFPIASLLMKRINLSSIRKTFMMTRRTIYSVERIRCEVVRRARRVTNN